MINKSIWSIKQSNICDSLKENLTTDVLIIGGGITGLSTAYHLKNSNLKITLVEKNEICSGITNRSTGKLTYLQDNYLKIYKYHGLSKTKLYLESQKYIVNLVSNIIKDNNIDCNLEKSSSYLFANKNLNKETKLFKKLDIEFIKDNKLPNNINKECIYVKDTYVINPTKYVYGLKEICKNYINIYENTKVTDIKKIDDYYICKTPNNIIKAKYVVIASHYPYFLIPFLFPMKTYIEKSYIKASKVNKNLFFNSISVDKPFISTRYYTLNDKTYEIYLNNPHNMCIKDNYKKNFLTLLDTKPDYIWSNKDIMTNDSLPFIGTLKENLLIGTGYNTWGITNGSLAGKIIADIILNNKNEYIELFKPKRNINIGKIINTPLIISSNIYSFIKSKIKKKKKWYPSNIKFEKRNGKNIAIYIDENKKEHIVYNLCPHLKCSLLFNEIERTWDCPCHGSRFDIDGNSIEGPSNYNITYKE